jgi:hypothetical protein
MAEKYFDDDGCIHVYAETDDEDLSEVIPLVDLHNNLVGQLAKVNAMIKDYENRIAVMQAEIAELKR